MANSINRIKHNKLFIHYSQGSYMFTVNNQWYKMVKITVMKFEHQKIV